MHLPFLFPLPPYRGCFIPIQWRGGNRAPSGKKPACRHVFHNAPVVWGVARRLSVGQVAISMSSRWLYFCVVQVADIGMHIELEELFYLYSLDCRERKFSETDSQDRATLYVRTGAKGHFAPVAYLRSRHLDTPPHKNSLAVSEKTAYRKPKYVLRVIPSGLLLAPVLGLEPPKSTITSGQGRTLKGFDLARCLTAPHGEGEGSGLEHLSGTPHGLKPAVDGSLVPVRTRNF